MSDSEDSTVTYTEISSPYEDLSDIGSPGAEGPIFQDPPSPDYVPGPEEPEQAPPSPIYVPFVPEPVYPDHRGYIPESDPEEDPEEDDEEDPEEDPADYPADKGDDRDDEEPSDDDDDDDDDDAEEEEHLAPADPAAVFLFRLTGNPYLAYRSRLGMSIRPRRCAPFLSEELVAVRDGSRAAGIRQRDALPSPVHETKMPEICLPLRKRPLFVLSWSWLRDAAPGRQTSRELGYGITDTWDDLEDDIIYSQLDDARHDRALLRARVNMLYRDRPFHRRTALLMEEEARVSRAAWAQSMDACDQDVETDGDFSDLLKSRHRRQRQDSKGPAKDPAEPELPEEAKNGTNKENHEVNADEGSSTTIPHQSRPYCPTLVPGDPTSGMIDRVSNAVLAARAQKDVSDLTIGLLRVDMCSHKPLQEGLPPVEEQEPGKWQRCSQGLCSGSSATYQTSGNFTSIGGINLRAFRTKALYDPVVPWGAPVLFVKKKDGDRYRWAKIIRELNKTYSEEPLSATTN
ncbi:hypothetical protein Tco_0487697 [Tanacetum coccineum]